MSSIFITIASYQDQELWHTVRSAVQNASGKHVLSFGIIDQNVTPCNTVPDWAKITYRYVPWRESQGVCWARDLGFKLYGGEDFVLQIDSHMQFDAGWDDYLLTMLAKLPERSILTTYPPSYVIENGVRVKKPLHDGAIWLLPVGGSKFQEHTAFIKYGGVPKSNVTEPIRGHHVAAGFMLARGSLTQEVPYDPNYYFLGEEQSFAVRAYTHGWDIYHPPKAPIYHLYSEHRGTRPLHWDAAQEMARTLKWTDLDRKSQERLKDLLYRGVDLGMYGLGKVRSLVDFANEFGVDYLNKTLKCPS